MIDFNIISTGSKGNAVVLDGCILVDAGVPFKLLQPCCRDIQLVLLTHRHGDHFKPATIRRLALERPTLRFGCCEWLVSDLLQNGVEKRNIDVYTPEKTYRYQPLSITPFSLIHDVPNCGYKIHFANGQKLIYATDTNSMSHIEAPAYDLYLLEANYTQHDIYDRIKNKQEQGVYCYEYQVLHNHLSREKAENWLYSNMSHNSRYVFLHGHMDEGA